MEVSMEELLQATIDEGGSDLHIRAYMPPELRVHGELMPLADESMSEEDTYRLVKEIATEEQMAEVEANGGADFVFNEARAFSTCSSRGLPHLQSAR